ncbi:MAG: hypothetical protein PHG70_08160 [Synergistaceae bacterium]|nr:hypothetical protein [Synergistaceae bacterium]
MTDAELQKLIDTPKKMSTKGLKKLLERKVENAYKRSDIELSSETEHSFYLRIRESLDDPTDYSAILSVKLKSGETFNLVRCNGSSHSHKNRIEKTKLFGTHIHVATERYIEMGYQSEAFAEESAEYNNINEAIECLMKITNITYKQTDENATLF